MRILFASMLAILGMTMGCAANQGAPNSPANEAASREAWVTHDEFEMSIASNPTSTERSTGNISNNREAAAGTLRPHLATHTKE